MIKTLVYTSEFIHNLSKYKKSHPVDVPQAPRIERKIEEKVEEKKYFVPASPYEPKFKTVDLNVTSIKTRLPPKLDPIEYNKIERTLYIKPDLSNDIQNAKNRITGELKKQEKILEKEQQAINEVKNTQESLRTVIHNQDLRPKSFARCEEQRRNLIECLHSRKNCEDFTSIWKTCQETFN